MKKLDRNASANRLKSYQRSIVFRGEEDEGAAEHWAEVEAVIEAVHHAKNTDREVEAVAGSLQLEKHLVYVEGAQ